MKILVTGGAGFIGSNLVERLLSDDRIERVRVLDNLATGSLENIQEILANPRFEFVQGDIRDFGMCTDACDGIDAISHQAALGSVPRSIKDPLTTNDVNITGTLHIFAAAREKKVQRIVYACSSSTYGDHPGLPKVEDVIGKPLSPYAITKYVNELYADVFARTYDMEFVGLRYFNVFGPKQNPNGPYAAVIPLFSEAIMNKRSPVINGNGQHSRDFTYVDNAVEANVLSLFTTNQPALNQVYNIGCGQQTSLVQLVNYLNEIFGTDVKPVFQAERAGDVLHSLANISKAENLLGYRPLASVRDGLQKTANWYKSQASNLKAKV